MTHGSLFSGVGGFDLGFERAGIKTVWQVERDPYCLKVLEKHWPDVRRYDDVRTAHPPHVDILSGGFPCQDISHSGPRTGITGSRSSLWNNMVSTIRMVRPKIAIVENVAALLHRGMGTVLGDLAKSGYDTEWDCVSACEFGAPHTRERVFIISYADRFRWIWGRFNERQARQTNSSSGRVRSEIWCATPDPLCRVAYGISKKVGFSLLGNAIVPAIAEEIGRMIVAVDRAQRRDRDPTQA